MPSSIDNFLWYLNEIRGARYYCSYCGYDSFTVVVGDQANGLGNVGSEFYRVACMRCGHTELFSAEIVNESARKEAGCRNISRRTMLAGAAFAVGVAATAAAPSQASAQQKLAQADANYQSTPKGSQRCGVCFNFRPPNSCKFVRGDISPNGWCQLFAPKIQVTPP